LVLRRGERLFSTLTGGGLFEPRREPGHWSGRSAGVSVPVGIGGLRVRVGKSAGTYVQGAEEPTVIDTGSASITNERVVFQGGKYTREWDFSRLIGVIHYADKPATAIQVSNRQKTSGIVYPGAGNAEPFRLALTVAIAVFHGEAAETIIELKDELAKLDAVSNAAPGASADAAPVQHVPDGPAQDPAQAHEVGRPDSEGSHIDSTRPAEPVVAARPATPPPMWAPDPSGRHQLRYWDGTGWTEYVSDSGRQSRDPLPA
jgi:hypothetical protein